MQRPILVWTIMVLLLHAQVGRSDGLPDLARFRNTLRKEPDYVCKHPRYGLAAFGPKADKALWLVLDKSSSSADAYDVLFIDRDGDGDLTGKGERLTIESDGRFRVPDFIDPSTGAKHGALTVRVDGERSMVMLSLQWHGKFRIGGGYPQDPDEGYMRFADRPTEAPVVWLAGDAPVRFQRWYSGKLSIGEADDFKVFLGQPGLGKHAFCAAQEHILPDYEWVRATLIYRDGMGKEQRLVCELRERC